MAGLTLRIGPDSSEGSFTYTSAPGLGWLKAGPSCQPVSISGLYMWLGLPRSMATETKASQQRNSRNHAAFKDPDSDVTQHHFHRKV